MNDPTSNDLLGYVLGALEPDEHAGIETQLDEDSGLREELDFVRSRIAVLDQMDPPGAPPAGLARRTCETVSSLISSSSVSASEKIGSLDVQGSVTKLTRAERYRRTKMSEQAEVSPARERTLLMDFVIVASVIMLLAAIVIPTLNQNRYESRRLACQNNIRQAGMGLLEYSQNHDGKFVPIPQDGNLSFAGVYAPTLIDAGYVEEPNSFFCAGSPLSRGGQMLVPSLDKLRSAKGKILHKLQKVAGGDYAYSLGQLVNGRYRVPKNLRRDNYLLLADAPSAAEPGRSSNHHNGYGQNGFFEDGHVMFLESPVVNGDAIYENDWGYVAPGTSSNDIVVAPSITPLFNAVVD